jgi:hypothetical protein
LRLTFAGSTTIGWEDAAVPDMTAEDLAQHLDRLEDASREDLDELLHDLLVRVYPTKDTQDS